MRLPIFGQQRAWLNGINDNTMLDSPQRVKTSHKTTRDVAIVSLFMLAEFETMKPEPHSENPRVRKGARTRATNQRHGRY
ncbi:hypothetical protein O9992_16825 [Vibrio lentus]|nr:hypothetical protein [Vibrio lentus]